MKDILGRNGWNIIIDGNQTVLFTNKDTTEYKITCSLDSRMHDLYIIKRTETLFGAAEFLGIQIDNNEKVELVKVPERRIELYGASFTTGNFILFSID